MLQRNFLFIQVLIISFFFSACQEKTETNIQQAAISPAMNKTETKEKLLRHVVIFKFKDSSSEEDVNRLNEAFNALPEAIPVIKDFEWGINDSPENFHQDFTHCYLLTFASEEDRDSVYTPHPKHQAFVASLQDHLEKVFVVDYWTNP
ncbi:MAG: Dabb family protein [Bacteroidota bacterium]